MAEGTSITVVEAVPALGKKIWIVGGVLSSNETLTVTGATTLSGAILLNEADNASDTCTVATNVITLTQGSITDATYTGIAWGV